ncbi:hypothetical protein HanIR_Chr14g0726311 [Helianthus annuus]|uniref:Uncharacterized protein n=1 Tax=Helianthus annuus TaxID=4232 RepID=A0A251SM07_HELAN|nr:hypothetical protein HanIR_Chr14g0726311 [Helianthus annuus]
MLLVQIRTRNSPEETGDVTGVVAGNRKPASVLSIRIISLVRPLGTLHFYSCVFTRNRNATKVDSQDDEGIKLGWIRYPL